MVGPAPPAAAGPAARIGCNGRVPHRDSGLENAQGLTTNLLNPEVGVCYVSLIPRFAVPGVSPALVATALAGPHAAMSPALFAAVAGSSAGRLEVLSARPRVARGIDAVCGVWLIGFAALVAWKA